MFQNHDSDTDSATNLNENNDFVLEIVEMDTGLAISPKMSLGLDRPVKYVFTFWEP